MGPIKDKLKEARSPKLFDRLPGDAGDVFQKVAVLRGKAQDLRAVGLPSSHILLPKEDIETGHLIQFMHDFPTAR